MTLLYSRDISEPVTPMTTCELTPDIQLCYADLDDLTSAGILGGPEWLVLPAVGQRLLGDTCFISVRVNQLRFMLLAVVTSQNRLHTTLFVVSASRGWTALVQRVLPRTHPDLRVTETRWRALPR